jgi:hypothetical protein
LADMVLQQQHDQEPSSLLLSNAVLENFKNCKVSQLKVFCHVRLLETESPSLLNQKKGSVQEASTGVENLLWLAHSFCGRPVRLSNEVAQQEEDEQQGMLEPTVREVLISGTSNGHGDCDNFAFVTPQFMEATFTTFNISVQRTLELARPDYAKIKKESCQLAKILRQRFQTQVQKGFMTLKRAAIGDCNGLRVTCPEPSHSWSWLDTVSAQATQEGRKPGDSTQV